MFSRNHDEWSNAIYKKLFFLSFPPTSAQITSKNTIIGAHELPPLHHWSKTFSEPPYPVKRRRMFALWADGYLQESGNETNGHQETTGRHGGGAGSDVWSGGVRGWVRASWVTGAVWLGD